MKIQDLFESAMNEIQSTPLTAKKKFEEIIDLLGNISFEECSKEYIYIFALSNMSLFQISRWNDMGKAETSIASFEFLLEKYIDEIEDYESVYEPYIVILELTYQYKKARTLLLKLMQCPQTKKIALKFLSSYAYCAEGLQTFNDCISFKEQLIRITDDLEEKQKLEKELKAMKD